VIAQRVGDRAGLHDKRGPGAIAQRPAKRGGRGHSAETLGARLRSVARYFPFALKLALAIAAGVLVFAAYRAAASASFFQVRSVELRGTTRASAEQIQAVVRRELRQSGVWQADLSAVCAQLEHLPWVRTAVVSRLLPDGIRVRITERVQRAVVRTSSGRFVWVDDDAVMLGEMSPTDQMPTFFLRGWNEEKSEAARAENKERVQKYLDLVRDWNAAGLSERVSEVNLIDVNDIRAQLAGDDSLIEVRLGSKDPGARLKKALEVLDEFRQTPRGSLISHLDVTQGKRVIVGFTSGAQIGGNTTAGSQPRDGLAPASDTANGRSARLGLKTSEGSEKGNKSERSTEAKNRNRARGN
jgi:cell division septal protein FtsQ